MKSEMRYEGTTKRMCVRRSTFSIRISESTIVCLQLRICRDGILRELLSIRQSYQRQTLVTYT